MKPPMECVIFFKTIAYLDDILPIILVLKKDNLISKTTFIAYKRKTFDITRKNIVLYKGIQETGGHLICMNRYSNRYVNQLYNLFILGRLLRHSLITIETYYIGNKILKIFTTLNKKIFKGKKILSLLDNKPNRLAQNTVAYYKMVNEDHTISERTVAGYDAVLLCQSLEEYEKIRSVKLNMDKGTQVVQVGYTRAIKEWKSFLQMNRDVFFSPEIKKPYIFFPLSALGAGHLKGENCISLSEKFMEVLLVLRNYCDDIQTVFKPHHKTDLEEFNKIITETGFKNYLVSYAHPLILIPEAEFTLTYHSTSLLFEAHVNGCITVEYAHYDSRFFEFTNGKSRYDKCVDYFVHRDMNELNNVLNKLVYDKDLQKGTNTNKIHNNMFSGTFKILTSHELENRFHGLFRSY